MPRLPIVLVVTLTLLAASALAGCSSSSSNTRDSDGDGITDAQERLTRTVPVTRADGTTSLRVSSDPNTADTDGDGLRDDDEFFRQTDPGDVDTDHDGMLDGLNVTLSADDARVAAWRERGILESPALTFLGELGFCKPTPLKPDQWSSDRPFADQLADGDELRGWNVTTAQGTVRVQGDPCTADADQDGAQDHVEKEMGTHPQVADTDGDGALDGYDLDPVRDLRVRFDAFMVDANGTQPVTLYAAAGEDRESIVATLGGALTLDVPDTTADRASLPVEILLTAEGADGQPVRLFPSGDSAVLRVDLVTNETSLAGQEMEAGRVDTSGDDGRIAFAWRVVRD